MRIASFGFASIVAVALLAGCGGGGPSVNYVEGTVTLDGAPLAGATITFSPVAGGTGKPAVGTTDANGVFKVTDMSGGTHEGGVVAGEYEVGVVKNLGTMAATDPDAWKTDPNYGKEESHTKPTPITSEVPTKYNDPKTSGIKVTVKPGENKGVTVELKK